MKTTQRITWIDTAKGIGIILVVAGHSCFLPNDLLTWISSFHMPLFFLLSGMLLSYTNAAEKPLKLSIKKKARTTLVPYLSFSILSIVFTLILEPTSFSAYLPNALLQTVCFYGISVLWFLPALFFGETIFLFIRKKTSLVTSGCCALLLCLLTIFIANTYHHHYLIDFDNPLSILGAYCIAVIVRTGMAVSFLAMGYYLPLFHTHKTTAFYLLSALLTLILSIVLSQKNGLVDMNYLLFHNYLFYFSAALCGSLFVICLCAALSTPNGILTTLLSKIGKNSLIIMATHMNCRFLGICYAVGNLALTLFPTLTQLHYQLICAIVMILLEIAAIFIINRFLGFLIGQFSPSKGPDNLT